MTRYPTEYTTCGGTYCSYVWAGGEREALALMAARGLGERPGAWLADEIYPAASELVCEVFAGRARPIDLAHAATWLSFLAISSGVCDAHETLGDTGVLHQVIHDLDALEKAPNEDHSERVGYLIRLLQSIEEQIPGYCKVE